MNRRDFVRLTGAVSVVLPFATIARAGSGMIDYTPGLVEEALADGQTVFVDYSASWCGTCARQERVINQLRAENTGYDQAMTFVRVDWDAFKAHPVTTSRNIPRRSTLLVLRGEEELGRVVAGTSVAQIKALMDKGLAPDA